MKRLMNIFLFIFIALAGSLSIILLFDMTLGHFPYLHGVLPILLLIFWGFLLYYLIQVKKLIRSPLIKSVISLVYTFLLGSIIIIVLMSDIFTFLDNLTPIVLFIFWGAILYYMSRQTKYNHQSKVNTAADKKLEPVSAERKAYYQAQGLSDDDIDFFRQTMNTAKYQIIRTDQAFQSSSKLKAIRNRTSVIQISQNLFKEIVNAPKRLSDADKFLYVHLPSLEKLTNKYIEIDNHQKKTKDTIRILNESSQTIEKMCEAIINDYLLFMESDVQDFSEEIELAKRRLKKDDNEQLFK